MIFNPMNLFNDNLIFKNSDKFRRVLLAYYSVNASKKGKIFILEQYHSVKRHKIIRCYEGFQLKCILTKRSHLSSRSKTKNNPHR